MYYQNYEDYMRNVLGYPNALTPYDNMPQDNYYQVSVGIADMPKENEELYPEIYRLVYPMVCKACEGQEGREITEDLIEEMTNNIYINFEAEDTQSVENRKVENRNGDVRNPRAKEEVRETRQSNPFLRDLIRILILRELYDRRRPRPPFPGGPRPPRPPQGPGPRPPYPGGPRPPMPRGYDSLYY